MLCKREEKIAKTKNREPEISQKLSLRSCWNSEKCWENFFFNLKLIDHASLRNIYEKNEKKVEEKRCRWWQNVKLVISPMNWKKSDGKILFSTSSSPNLISIKYDDKLFSIFHIFFVLREQKSTRWKVKWIFCRHVCDGFCFDTSRQKTFNLTENFYSAISVNEQIFLKMRKRR